MTKDALSEFRSLFADLVTAKAAVEDPRLRAAFAAVPREAFLGAGPWKIFAYASEKYIETPSDNPAFVYGDEIVAILPERGVNNGLPSLHAACLAAVAPQPGERVLQVGVGEGYYSAVLAQLVAPGGLVEAIEIDPELAARATRNLADCNAVTVSCRSGAAPPLPRSDVIYVCAGATEPLAVWCDALAPGGRLIFPLAPEDAFGAMLMVTRLKTGFAARFVCRAAFIPCVGAQSEAAGAALKAAFQGQDWREVKALHRDGRPPDESCWLAGDGWWLSTRPLSLDFIPVKGIQAGEMK